MMPQEGRGPTNNGCGIGELTTPSETEIVDLRLRAA